jgi:pentapeptide repeat protein
MTVVVDDPLITRMSISRTLPLHESSQRLRELYPECPRVYGVAVMSDLSRRRWWPLADVLTTDRLQAMFDVAASETENCVAVTQQLAATLAHVVIGRVIPLLVLEGRAWDTGLENLWVHVDSEGAIDWVGVVDPTLRALPDDAHFSDDAHFDGAHFDGAHFDGAHFNGDAHFRDGTHSADRAGLRRRQPSRDRIVALPNEAALTTWVAHRSHRSLEPLFGKLLDVSRGAVSVAAMWHVVGTAVVSAATQVPLLAGSSELTSMRRGQAVLDALVGFGAPVRGSSRQATGKALLN